jgi:VanZ family protein
MAIAWTTLIAILTLLPGSTIDRFNLWGILSFDKIGHFGLYMIYAFLVVNKLITTLKKSNFWSISIISFAIAALFGIVLEIIQGMIPGRNFDFVDLIFNIAGAISGLAGYKIFTKFSQVI